MKILGIETSCDETAVCLLETSGEGADFTYRVLGNALISQAAAHAEYGGVFPNLAKREHIKNLPILFESVMQQAGNATPDVIAVTVGPGLEPCLWTGITFAQELAAGRLAGVPIVAANHMEGHILVSLMTSEHSDILKNMRMSEFELPVLALLISGGHTELILMKEIGSYEYIGRTRDDAAGEAFDKVARLLELPYPGGPEISKLAEEARAMKITPKFTFTSPMLNSGDFDFSFSGLKTEVRRAVSRTVLDAEIKREIALAFENAVTEVLVEKTVRAASACSSNTVVVGGGVSANTHIRNVLTQRLAQEGVGRPLVPAPELATDNAIMIALAGHFHVIKNDFANPADLKADGNLCLA